MRYYSNCFKIILISISLNSYAFPFEAGQIVHQFKTYEQIKNYKNIVKLNSQNYTFKDRRVFYKINEVLVDPNFKFNYCRVVATNSITNANNKTSLNTNIASFSALQSSGNLKIRTFLPSDLTQSCNLDNI